MSVPGYNVSKLSNFDKNQRNIFNQGTSSLASGGGVSNALDFLQRLSNGDPELFKQLEAPAQEQFQRSLGDIGTRFSQFGGRDSSAFQNAVAGAGAEMSQNLQSQRLGLQTQAINDLMGHVNSLLNQRPEDRVITPEEGEGGIDWGQLIATLGPELLNLLGPGGQAASTGIKAFKSAMPNTSSVSPQYTGSKSLPSFQYNMR